MSKLIAQLELNIVDANKTAVGDALGTAVARLRHSDATSKVIIVLTDGFNNSGKMSPEDAIDGAVKHGAKVYTVQIGDGAEVEVLKGRDPFSGRPIYGRTRNPTDPELLKRIADKTGGKYFLATDVKGLQESMHDILDELEKTQFEASVAHYEELFPLLLFPGVVLIGIEALLRSLLLRRFP
ncbi:MAG: VWA domain-containing protein [Myxococcota bacterium]